MLTMEQDKINKLEELKKEIQNRFEKENVWFFSQDKEGNQDKNAEINGYWGTEKIIFLAKNPSRSKKESNTKKVKNFFDDKLIKFGFEKAHITDLIKRKLKQREEVKEFCKEEEKVIEQIEYLRREIKIISPKIIVLVGKWVEKYEKEIKGGKDIKTFQLPHYEYRFCLRHYGKTKEEIYDTKLKEIREEYDALIKKECL